MLVHLEQSLSTEMMVMFVGYKKEEACTREMTLLLNSQTETSRLMAHKVFVIFSQNNKVAFERCLTLCQFAHEASFYLANTSIISLLFYCLPTCSPKSTRYYHPHSDAPVPYCRMNIASWGSTGSRKEMNHSSAPPHTVFCHPHRLFRFVQHIKSQHQISEPLTPHPPSQEMQHCWQGSYYPLTYRP